VHRFTGGAEKLPQGVSQERVRGLSKLAKPPSLHRALNWCHEQKTREKDYTRTVVYLQSEKSALFPIRRSFSIQHGNNLTGRMRSGTKEARPIIRFKLFALSSGAANCSGIQRGRILLFARFPYLGLARLSSSFFFLLFFPLVLSHSLSFPHLSLSLSCARVFRSSPPGDLPPAFSRASFRSRSRTSRSRNNSGSRLFSPFPCPRPPPSVPARVVPRS